MEQNLIPSRLIIPSSEGLTETEIVKDIKTQLEATISDPKGLGSIETVMRVVRQMTPEVAQLLNGVRFKVNGLFCMLKISPAGVPGAIADRGQADYKLAAQ